MIALALALGCAPTEPPPDEVAVPAVFVPLDDARLARRMSIDLRGVLPTASEVARAADGELDVLVDAWMEDARFESHLAEVYAETWQLRLDELRVEPQEFGLEPDVYAFTRALGDEPAHLIARVAATDRPFTDIVTSDTTMANDTLAAFAPLEFTDAAESGEWREARYTDGRPANGVLATSGLWLRYHTTIFNFNRGRAAAIAQLLLCHDFLARPVAFVMTDTTEEGLYEAILTDPGCVACHASLDPLASALFGFWPYEDKDGLELITYHPERERYGETLTGYAPAYFGTPIDSAGQLGALVAGDPRFEMCTVEQAAERLWGRDTTTADLLALGALREDLRAGDFRYRALLRGVLATDEYRAGDLTDAATDDDRARVHTLRTLAPATLASIVEDLTGYRWTWEGWDELDSDETGYRHLLGGADGVLVQRASLEPGLSRSLVIRRLAQAAASHVVRADLAAAAGDRRLVATSAELDAISVPESDAFFAQLDALHLRLYSVPPTEAQRLEEAAFFASVQAASTDEQAWASLVSVLLRDPAFWSY